MGFNLRESERIKEEEKEERRRRLEIRRQNKERERGRGGSEDLRLLAWEDLKLNLTDSFQASYSLSEGYDSIQNKTNKKRTTVRDKVDGGNQERSKRNGPKSCVSGGTCSEDDVRKN